ncbi:MAG: ASCH domain-containing protein [Gammaproteobacteria bacterium]
MGSTPVPMPYLPPGCGRPSMAELGAFWANARRRLTGADLPDEYRDDDTTRQVLDLIRAGDKTGTFTLPWIVDHTEQPTPAVGDAIILVDFDGHPHLLVRLTHIEEVPFGRIGTVHTAIDGTPVRDLAVWRPLHTKYWNGLLEPFGLAVSADMPVWVEKFELLYDG